MEKKITENILKMREEGRFLFPFKVTGRLLSSGWGGKVASGACEGVQGRMDRTRSWRWGGGLAGRACREWGLEGLFFFKLRKDGVAGGQEKSE